MEASKREQNLDRLTFHFSCLFSQSKNCCLKIFVEKKIDQINSKFEACIRFVFESNFGIEE